MNPSDIVEAIKITFDKVGSTANIPMPKGGLFEAKLLKDGVRIDHQGNECLLPWSTFIDVVNLLHGEEGIGSTPNHSGLYITDIHGVPAYVVYGAQLRQSVYKNIVPIISIFIWAKICRYESNFLVLNECLDID